MSKWILPVSFLKLHYSCDQNICVRFSAILNLVTITVSHGTKMSKRASKPWISQYFDCADSNIISEVEGMVRRGTTVEGV